MKKGKNGPVRNCVKNEGVQEGADLTNLTPDEIKGIGMMIQNGHDIPTIIRIFDNKPTAEQITAIATSNMKQGVAEGPEYNEYSDEVDMVENNLLTIIRACKELADTLKAGENLPEWVEEKISMSKQNMVTVSEYLQSQHDQGHVYDEDHSTATGGWGQGSMNAAYKSSALAGAGHDDRAMEGYFGRLQERLDIEVDERSVSQAQAHMMAAAAHNPAFAKKVGIKTNVAKDFNKADTGRDISKLPKRVIPKKKK
jgi:hypothetical protein